MIFLLHFLWFFDIVQPSPPHVTWEEETGIIRLGETVVLTCTVHEIEELNLKEARQWFRESKLVCYNGQPTNPMKYMEHLNKNEFKLRIFNVSENDLNCEYQCLYSFETYSKILEITSKNFEYPPPENTTDIEYNYARNGSFSVKLHFKKVFPLPNCTVVFEAYQLPFTEKSSKKNGLYFEVQLVHQSHIILNTSAHFNVTCQLLNEYLIATKLLTVDTGQTNILYIVDSGEQMVALLFITVSIAVILITVVYFTIKHCDKKTKKPSQKGLKYQDPGSTKNGDDQSNQCLNADQKNESIVKFRKGSIKCGES